MKKFRFLSLILLFALVLTVFAPSAAALDDPTVDAYGAVLMAIDGDTAQTGPGIAYHLGIPQITFCDNIDTAEGKVIVRKIIDGGHQIMEADLPALVTMTMPFDYVASYPSFLGAFRAQNKVSLTWTAADIGADPKKLGLDGSPTRVDRIFPPPARPKGQIFNAGAGELADKVLEILAKEEII